jgi:AsmA protein
VAGVKLTQIGIGVHAHGGVMSLAPANAKLYGGQCAGSVTIDARTPPSKLTIEESLTSIDVAQLLNDVAKTRRLSGRGNVNVRLTARGTSGDALTRSLNRPIDSRLANGALEGIDLAYEIQRAQSLLKEKTLPGGSSTGRTAFDTFQASAQISNGIATTKDLTIAAAQLRVTGQGVTNLNTLGIDYSVKATLLKSAAIAAQNAGGLTLVDIPVKITGTLTNPTVRPDLEGVAKARVQQELDKHKDELKQKLKDQLQNIFKR